MSTEQITSYGIINPIAGNDYFTNAGVAYGTGTVTEPTINVGRALGLGTAGSTQSAGMNEILLGDAGRTVFSSQIVPGPRQKAIAANLTTGAVAASASSGGFLVLTDAGHGFSVGQHGFLLDTTANSAAKGPFRVTAVAGNAFTTNIPYTSGAGTLVYYKHDTTSNFATMTAGKYIAYRLSNEQIHGISSTLLRSGANAGYTNRRSIHKVESAFNHLAVATAIRAGFWDIFTGTFSTAPTATENSVANVAGATVTDGTADNAASPTRAIPGELVYKQSGAQNAGTANEGTLLDDYQGKTGG